MMAQLLRFRGIRGWLAGWTAACGVLCLGSPVRALLLPAAAPTPSSCQGNANQGSPSTGSGANCGLLTAGETFAIDVTAFLEPLGDPGFDTTEFGIGVATSGGSTLAVSELQALFSGRTSNGHVVDLPLPVWAATPGNAFGSALASGFAYTASNSSSLTFAFGDPGVGIFGGKAVTSNGLGLLQVEQLLIRGRLNTVADPLASNVISFAVGRVGAPSPGSSVGGFFSTEVPGPLPLAGAAGAMAWSRRLRRKLNRSES